MEQVAESVRTTTFPYSAICQLRMDFPNSPSNERGLHRGTGSLVGKNVLLTSGHNILHPVYGQVDSIELLVGKDLVSISGPFWTHKEWKGHVAQRLKTFSPFDYGIITLPRGYGVTQGKFKLDPDPKNVTDVTVAGFRAPTVVGTQEILLKGNGRLLYSKDPKFKLVYSVNTVYGISGGPIFYRDKRADYIYRLVFIQVNLRARRQVVVSRSLGIF